MQQLTLYNGNKNNHINVSMDFIDNFLCDAPGEFVKVYLYLLRCMEMNSTSLSITEIADRFNDTEKDVLRALAYWEKKSLLTLDYDQEHNLQGIHFQGSAFKKEPVYRTPIQEFPTVDTLSNAKVSRSRMLQLADNPEVKQILFITSQYLGKTLTPTEIEILIHIYDNLGFSEDLIEYLIESSVEKDRKSLQYIEKIAQQWYKDGISTVSQAKKASTSNSQSCLSIMNALGISGRVLAQSEADYVQKWLNSYGFPIELVVNACSRTIQTIGQPSFRYTDTILTNWHQQQVQTLDDIKALDMQHQAKVTKVSDKPSQKTKKAAVKGNNFQQRSYDYDTLEQQLLNVN